MKQLLFILAFVAIVAAITVAGATARAETLDFAGAVVMPAGGEHPGRPVVSRQVVQQTIRATDFRVLEIVYR